MHDETDIRHVGCIGLGIMGAAMAANLRKAGFDLTVWNRTAAKMQALVAAGAHAATSPADLAARGPQVICINVTDTPDVESILFGEQGVAAAAKPGLIVIDHSTIDPDATQRFAARLAASGVTLLDAPVSGGDTGARAGTLSIMVGGPAEAFARVRPVLAAVGRTITHVGPSGMGQACKACNQAAVVGALLGTCEAIALARKLGLDPRTMLDVVGAGAGSSWQLTNLGPRIVSGDFDPGFMIDLILKDLGIVTRAADAAGLDLAAVKAAQQRFQTLQTRGQGRLGTQALYQAIAPDPA